MKVEINDKQLEKVHKIIQGLIDSELNSLREDSEEWGLGEMDELDEIDSVDKIIINRISPHQGISVYIDIYTNTGREEYDNVRGEIQYRVSERFPKIKLFIKEINSHDS
jgi:hypothetical protein